MEWKRRHLMLIPFVAPLFELARYMLGRGLKLLLFFSRSHARHRRFRKRTLTLFLGTERRYGGH